MVLESTDWDPNPSHSGHVVVTWRVFFLFPELRNYYKFQETKLEKASLDALCYQPIRVLQTS